MLRERLSPQQIAGKLRTMSISNLRDVYVCRETICNAIHALAVGEMRKVIICLREGKRLVGHARMVWIGAGRYPRWSASMCDHLKLKTR
jgi:IS30 family transposase